MNEAEDVLNEEHILIMIDAPTQSPIVAYV